MIHDWPYIAMGSFLVGAYVGQGKYTIGYTIAAVVVALIVLLMMTKAWQHASRIHEDLK